MLIYMNLRINLAKIEDMNYKIEKDMQNIDITMKKNKLCLYNKKHQYINLYIYILFINRYILFLYIPILQAMNLVSHISTT